MTVKFEHREEWLNYATALLAESVLHLLYGFDTTNIKLSVGFPIGSRGSDGKLGQCLSASVSSSGKTEIYISPTLEDPMQVMAALHHELLHAHLGVEVGHGKEFKRAMTQTGLKGKATATEPGYYTKEKYQKIIDEIGEYPHSAVVIPERGSKGSPLKKYSCTHCNYTVRITEKWIRVGIPLCANVDCSRFREQLMGEKS